jgi:hypothetical protein
MRIVDARVAALITVSIFEGPKLPVLDDGWQQSVDPVVFVPHA